MPLLALDGVSAGYAELQTLFDVSFSVGEGSVTALLGRNGAGKTTVARVCSGLVRPSGGRVRFAGDDVTGLAPWRLARRGLVHAPEGRAVFASLSVEENLALAFRVHRRRKAAGEVVERALARFPVLVERRGQLAGTLSGGEQRMLALARVLADPPRLLVVDELSLGLAPIVLDELYRSLAAVREGGTAVLLVEQHVHRALSLADHVVLLDKGRVVHDGAPADAAAAVDALLPA
jgi:branched-chain amino acid transport system ATP-binding protein